MEQNPNTAIVVEKVKDCAFPFLADAYGARSMYALALGCDPRKIRLEIAERSSLGVASRPIRWNQAAPASQEVIGRGHE